MAISRGIIGTRGSTALKPTKLASIYPVAVVLLVPQEPALHYFDSPKDALDYFEQNISTSGGNWEKYLNLWEDNFPVTVPVLISTALPAEDADEQKANIITATNEMKKFGSKFDVRPDIVAVPDLAGDKSLATQMIVINEFYKSRSWYEIDASDSSQAILFRNEFASERLSIINTPFVKFNTTIKQNEFYDGGMVMAMQRAYIDSKKEYGWWDSISNRAILMDDAKNIADYHDGADETDPLSDNQIWCTIKDGGLRPWGSDYTCSTDPIWQNGSRVRLVDNAIKAIQKALRDSIDKDLNELSVTKSSLNAFKNNLIGQNVLLGGEIRLDEEKTTSVEITVGNFYFIFDFQDSPKTRKMVVHMNYVDRFSYVAYKLLEAQ